MHVPDRSASAACRLLAALAAGWFAAGCARPTPIEVTWDEREDLSRFRTWDWIDGHAVFVRAAAGDSAEVEAQLSALVESALRERGLERTAGNGELRVAALLVGTRTYQSSCARARCRRSTATTTSAGTR